MEIREIEHLLPSGLVQAVANAHMREGWGHAGHSDHYTAARTMLAKWIAFTPSDIWTAIDQWWYTRDIDVYTQDIGIRYQLDKESTRQILHVLWIAHKEGYSLRWARWKLLSKLHERLQEAILSCVSYRRGRLDSSHERLHKAIFLGVENGQKHLRNLDKRMRSWAKHWYVWAAATTISSWKAATPHVHFSPDLDETDKRLAKKWPHRSWEETTEDWGNRVYSARRAEKSALGYFEELGSNVRDVSITQLEGGDDEWRNYDLSVDGDPVDVKNVRGGAWGGWVVLDHAKSTVRGNEVGICGVVSDDDGQDYQRIVGETSQQKLERLRPSIKALVQHLGLSVHLAEMANWRRGLGAWLLEYRPEHYKRWDFEVLRAALMVERLEYWLGPVPNWLKGLVAWHRGDLVGDEENPVTIALRHWGRGAQESDRPHSIAHSRPALFMFVLLYLLSESKHCRWNPNSTKQQLLDCIFVSRNANDWQYPLGLHDPLKTIYYVVEAINQMIERNSTLVEQTTEFKLTGLGVLRARRNGKWFTLLAYCGECHRSPLWARGEEAFSEQMQGNDSDGYYWCHGCGRLVCRCGYCSKYCGEKRHRRG